MDSSQEHHTNFRIYIAIPKLNVLPQQFDFWISGPSSLPNLVTPIYPPLARLAHISGKVTFSVDVSESGQPTNFKPQSGHPMLVPSVEDSVKKWMFPRETSGSQTKARFAFIMNCPAKKQ